jgi:hypothetical protein
VRSWPASVPLWSVSVAIAGVCFQVFPADFKGWLVVVVVFVFLCFLPKKQQQKTPTKHPPNTQPPPHTTNNNIHTFTLVAH